MSAVRLSDILDAHDVEPEAVLRLALEAWALNVQEFLLLAAAQFGAMPGLTAKILMDSGLTPEPDEEQYRMVEQAFARDMEELRRLLGEQ